MAYCEGVRRRGQAGGIAPLVERAILDGLLNAGNNVLLLFLDDDGADTNVFQVAAELPPYLGGVDGFGDVWLRDD